MTLNYRLVYSLLTTANYVLDYHMKEPLVYFSVPLCILTLLITRKENRKKTKASLIYSCLINLIPVNGLVTGNERIHQYLKTISRKFEEKMASRAFLKLSHKPFIV